MFVFNLDLIGRSKSKQIVGWLRLMADLSTDRQTNLVDLNTTYNTFECVMHWSMYCKTRSHLDLHHVRMEAAGLLEDSLVEHSAVGLATNNRSTVILIAIRKLTTFAVRPMKTRGLQQTFWTIRLTRLCAEHPCKEVPKTQSTLAHSNGFVVSVIDEATCSVRVEPPRRTAFKRRRKWAVTNYGCKSWLH